MRRDIHTFTAKMEVAAFELHFEDIRRLNVFLDRCLKQWLYRQTKTAYYSLSQLMVAKLIVFNRMKAGEASRVTDLDVLFSMNVQHKKLPKQITQNADRLTRAMEDEMYKLLFTTKYGRVSFVVLSPVMVDRVRDIMRLRDSLKLSKYQLLFIHPDNPDVPIEGNKALQEAAKSAIPDVPLRIVTAHHIREHYRLFTRDGSVDECKAPDKQYDTEPDDD